MGGYHNFYTGYGKATDGDNFLDLSYRAKPSQFGMATDTRTANQLKAVSDKINTGTRTIEVSTVNITGGGPGGILDSIPNQHLEELNRLKKLTGAELTFHGPLVEASGISQQGWDESKRIQAERQIFNAVERGHKLSPDGNIVITFHTSQDLPELQTRVKNAKGEEETKDFLIIDEKGGINRIPIQPNYLLKDEKPDTNKLISNLNKENWEKQLSSASQTAYAGRAEIEKVTQGLNAGESENKLDKNAIFYLYKNMNNPEGIRYLNDLGQHNPQEKKLVENLLNTLNHGDLYVRDSYSQLQTLFNKAYEHAKGDDKKKLDEFRDNLAPKINKGNLLTDPLNVSDLAEEVNNGIKLLSTFTPQAFKPLNEFVIDKTADTFSNVAFNAYKEFGYKKDKDTTPIISLENPPAGQALSHGEDVAQLINVARKKFVERAVNELDMSKKDAEKQAEKVLGVTWDVGHINMLRKYGYTDKDLTEQTEKIGKYLKHVHLSDNFGLEHTELPMGMGNVPKEQLELVKKFNEKAKHIIETGNWYQHFQRSPLPETFAAFGSPIYAMKMSPYWNQAQSTSGGYFSGFGNNPEYHHSLYGAGFSNLPVELGGQAPGRSRLSGNPME